MTYDLYPAPILGPCRCQGCREPLWWARRNSRRLGITYPKLAWREEDGTLHRCPEWQLALARARVGGKLQRPKSPVDDGLSGVAGETDPPRLPRLDQ